MPDKNKPRGMEEWVEQGRSMLHQEDQRREPREFLCDKELMEPGNLHHHVL